MRRSLWGKTQRRREKWNEKKKRKKKKAWGWEGQSIPSPPPSLPPSNHPHPHHHPEAFSLSIRFNKLAGELAAAICAEAFAQLNPTSQQQPDHCLSGHEEESIHEKKKSQRIFVLFCQTDTSHLDCNDKWFWSGIFTTFQPFGHTILYCEIWLKRYNFMHKGPRMIRGMKRNKTVIIQPSHTNWKLSDNVKRLLTTRAIKPN